MLKTSTVDMSFFISFYFFQMIMVMLLNHLLCLFQSVIQIHFVLFLFSRGEYGLREYTEVKTITVKMPGIKS